MRAFPRYLRTHRWQRRLLTATVALIAGLLAALAAYPTVQRELLLRRLGSDDPAVRAGAIARAVERAEQDPRLLRRLEEALETNDDAKFLAVAEVLRNLRRFHTNRRSGEAIDRLRALRLENPLPDGYSPADAEARVMLLMRTIADARDNVHVRRSLRAVAASRSPQLRELAAVLSARLGDCETLSRLLDDDDTGVKSTAALAAAASRCRELTDKCTEIFSETDDVAIASAAGYALAALDAQSHSELITRRLLETDSRELHDRLLLTSPMLEGGNTAVIEIIRRSRNAGVFAPAAALTAAARLRLTEAAPAAREVLAAAAEGSERLTESQVMAGMEVARALDMDVRDELDAYCRRHWSRRLSVSMAEAARLLAEQTAETNDADLRAQVVDTLVRAASYDAYVRLTGDDVDAAQPTPRASAEAAAGLWTLGVEDAESYVRRSAGSEDALSRETIAWRLSRSDPRRAFELGLALLPEPGAPPEQRVYNANERACGAMLLALSAETDQQQQARMRIGRRLDHVNEPFLTRGSLQCALAAMGDEDAAATVRELLVSGVFPRRRAMTALLATGDKAATDWLLWNRSLGEDEILQLLIDDGVSEVLREFAPDLPAVERSVGADVRRWRLGVLRVHYAVNRAGVGAGASQ